MTLHHKPDSEGEYTDEQLAEHLISSECSECVKAGYRFMILVKKCQMYEQGIAMITGTQRETD